MDKIALKQKILNFINDYEGFVTKGQIYDLCEMEGYSPENGARRARELAEEGKIIADSYKGKRGTNLTRYGKIGLEKPEIRKPQIVVNKAGERVAMFI